MGRPAGPSLDPHRAIVELAQADLPFDTFIDSVLGLLEKALGFDTAFAVRNDCPETLLGFNAGSEQFEIADLTLRHAADRYADELMPVFARSTQVGGCLDTQFFPSERSRRESAYFSEVLRPSGVRSMVQLCARWKGRPLLRVNLNRHGMRPFRVRDLEKALRLVPTLEASIAAAYGPAPAPLATLTPRELEISRLVARGLTNAQIGTVLGTSVFTVRNQLARIFEKLQLESRAELAAQVAMTHHA